MRNYEVEAGIAAAPFAVEQIAGDHQERRTAFDCEIDQLAERLARSEADFLHGRARVFIERHSGLSR